MAAHCPACMPRRAALALGLATLATPAAALDAIEPRFRRSPAPDGRRRVALTLDACNGGFDRRIADAVVAHHARATIFLTADWIRQNPAGLAFLLAHKENFRFENHGQHHLPAVLGTGTIWGLRIAGTLDAVRREVTEGAAAILAATGTTPHWYRAAAARYSPAAIPAITRLGFAIAAFTLNGDAGASLPAHTVAARASAARDGDILIGHINQPHRPSGEGWARAIATLAGSGVIWSDLDAMRPILMSP
ncbi:MAG: polysaccharide deacetylase family protein [Acetobacteraceae bacterium]|nr:polysaccharide deacetylase family protein [Acetobacteraceae bacterium]